MNEISRRKFKVCQNVLKKCPKKTFLVAAAAFGKETHPVSYVVVIMSCPLFTIWVTRWGKINMFVWFFKLF